MTFAISINRKKLKYFNEVNTTAVRIQLMKCNVSYISNLTLYCKTAQRSGQTAIHNPFKIW